MRARLALHASGCTVELREIALRDKHAAFLAASSSGTVPCLHTAAGVIDESLEIMHWALRRNDPDDWLKMPEAAADWIARNDGPFKHALDRIKYHSRYPPADLAPHRDIAHSFLHDLETALDPWLFDRPTLGDFALLPFVRQFAFIDKAWFDTQPWPNLQHWLAAFLASPGFTAIMHKTPLWHPPAPPVFFP